MTPTSISQLVAKDRLTWEAARKAAQGGRRILIATNVTGFHHASLLEATIAAALTLRGAEVDILVCDAALPACLKVENHSFPDPDAFARDGMTDAICKGCMDVGAFHFDPLGLRMRRFSEFLTNDDQREANAMCAGLSREALSALVTPSGDAVGMQGLAGALRYYARGELPKDETARLVLERFVRAAILTTRVFERLLAQDHYEAAVFHHGIYVPQGPAGDVMRRHGVRVVNWNPSYRNSTFIFSHGDSYHYTLMDEPVSSWEGMNWSEEQEAEILDYLASRAEGTRDWIWFFEKPDNDGEAFAREMGLDPSKPIIGMLSNVAWDAQLHFPTNAFENIFEWVYATFDYFATRPDMQLLLRIHPAEIRGTVPSRQLMADVIAARYPTVPPNIFIVGPEQDVSTYALLNLCSAAIIYGTKMGVELSAVGKPVIVAGEAWIRDKGLTHDASSRDDYLRLLATLPNIAPMSPYQLTRARKYAYHFFFRRMIPLAFMAPGKKSYDLMVERLEQLNHGQFAGLDTVCEGILSGAPFVFPAERLGLDG